MAKIISIILISCLSWEMMGYDFFIIASLLSFSIDIYKGIKKLQKRYLKYTKDKTARR